MIAGMSAFQFLTVLIILASNIVALIVFAFRIGSKFQSIYSEFSKIELTHKTHCDSCSVKFNELHRENNSIKSESILHKASFEMKIESLNSAMRENNDILHKIDKSISEHIAYHKGLEQS